MPLGRSLRAAGLAFGLAACTAAVPSLAQEPEIVETIGNLIGEILEGPIGAADPFAPAVEPDAVAPGELQGGVALPEDAALRRRLAQAVRLAEGGRAEDAAQALGRLAEAVGDADAFVRSEGESLRSAKAEVQRLLGESSPEIRAAYELAFGPAARRMLDESPADPAAVRRVANLYPHTRAGADALYRLAETYRDAGSFAEAAACLERLRTIHPQAAAAFEPHLSLRLALCRARSGDRPGAEVALRDLAARSQESVLTIAGASDGIPVADLSPDALLAAVTGPADETLSTTYTPHPGDADALPAPAAAPFLTPRWSVPLPDTDASERRALLGHSIPAIFPSVAGDVLLAPLGDDLVAYDLATGTRLWSRPSPGPNPSSPDAFYTDLARGRLSTDGRSAYLVEAEVSSPSTPAPAASVQIAQQQWGFMQAQAAFMMPNAAAATGPTLGPATNVLTALDVAPPRQGNRLWGVGGASGGDEPRLAGHAFLGPPLAAHGRLYAVAEYDRTVRLVVLDPDTGRLDWSLDLGQAEISLSADPQRGRIGATPTLTRGTLLCPTAGGSVVAVDLPGRSLLWGYRYPRSSPPVAAEWDDSVPTTPEVSGWTDGTIRVAGDRVLLTPPESAELYCLDLRTGRPLWQRPRDENLFLATTDADRVLLVGKSGTTLLSAADGSPVGTPIPFPAGAAPSGRGYLADSTYVQPLSDGTFWQIELATGSAAESGRVFRGLAAGNLVWHAGTLLSLAPDALRAFDGRDRLEVEIRTRLAAAPNDPAALLRRADLHTAAGRYAEAITDCRAAHAADSSPQIRNRLIAALLDGVRVGLPDAPAYDAELTRLATPR